MARWHISVTVRREGHDAVKTRFDHTPVTIGGSANNDVVLAGPHVSGRHATVSVSGGNLVYQDRSTNGSFVSGQRIRERTLEPDDSVGVPPYQLTFTLESDQTQPTVPLPAAEMPSGDRRAQGQDERVPAGGSGGGVPARQRARSSFQMHLTKAPGALQGHVYAFDRESLKEGDPILVGRAADSHISLDFQSVSRRHATLVLMPDGRWQLVDGGSRNGITVNGDRVKTAVLSAGDEIAFGPDVTAVFHPQTHRDEPERKPATPAADGDQSTSKTDTLTVTHRRSSVDGGVVVVGIKGRVDGYNYAEFRERLNQLIDAGNHLLILDFSLCRFCDHVGLSVVLSAKTALDKHHGRLCLIGANERFREGLSLLRLNTLLAVETDEASAVRRLLK